MEDYEISYLPEENKPIEPQKKKLGSFFDISKENEHWQPESPDEGYLNKGLKTLDRLTRRAGEVAIGLPGDIASLGLGAANIASLGRIPSYGQIQEKVGHELLPTSAQLKERTQEELPHTRTKSGSAEEVGDRIVETMTSLGIGGFGAGVKRAAASVLGSEVVGWAAKELGASEGVQAALRMGTLFLGQMFGTRGLVKEQASEGFKVSREMARGAETTAPKLHQQALKLKKEVESGAGGLAESKEWLAPWVNKLVDKFKGNPVAATAETVSPILDTLGKPIVTQAAQAAKKAKPNKISVNDAIEFIQDLREQWRDGKIPSRAQPGVQRMINMLKENIIKPFAEKNKKFADTFYPAEEAWAALGKGNRISEFFNQYLNPKNYRSPITQAVFGAGLFEAGRYIVSSPMKSIPLAVAGLATREAYRAASLFANSKIARNAYFAASNAALAGNVAAMAKNAAIIDKEAVKYDKEHPQDDSEGEWTIDKL